MNLVLLLPAALAALAALLLPLLLHLARRQQQVPTVFAALRWLRAKPKPRRRIRFDEWPLLAVRLLLLALLAFWLARPVLQGAADATPWIVVAPGVDRTARDAAIAGAGDAQVRWLAPGFPAIERAQADLRVPVSSLLRELDASLPKDASLTVLVPERLAGADGERPRLSRAVDWRVVPDASPPPDPVRLPPPPFAIRHDAGHAASVRYLRAAAQSWQADDATGTVEVTEAAEAPLPGRDGVLAWLRADPLPGDVVRWVEQGGQVLLAVDAAQATPAAVTVWRDAAGEPLLEATPLGKGRVLRFARALEPRAMPQLLDPGFPRRLREGLQPVAVPTVVAASAHAPRADGAAWPQPPRDLQPWLAALVALLALLERWLATSRRRELRA
ncbi:MAG: BatA domain-containing protein [Luteimonas sp.]|nr:BatA domain-containing protein [Luteimonas sp.]